MIARSISTTVTFLALAFAVQFDAGAALRASAAAETVIRDSSKRLSAGDLHTCRALVDGTVRCWGENLHGQLGDGTTTDRLTPVTVSGLTNAVAVTAGRFHSCALLANGTVRCWGENGTGILGDGTEIDRLAPVAVSGLNNVVAIATGSGATHTCALLVDGTVRCWGFNARGQLGDASTTNRLAPVAVTGLVGAVAITAGSSHTCALLSDGTAKCWGDNVLLQLGDPVGFSRTTPVFVRSLVNAVAISAGGGHTCALVDDGTMRCWGANTSGQLGDNTLVDKTGPGAIPVGVSNVVAITTGGAQTCAHLADGNARCWGENSQGELGDGSTTDRHTAVDVSGILRRVMALAGGGAHTCALFGDNSISCWGSNVSGQLGNNTTTSSTTPTLNSFSNISEVNGRRIANGGSHTCAVRDNSSMACWGGNQSGQLGIGSMTNQVTPVGIGFGNIGMVAAGSDHTCILFNFGSASCTGANDAGQLGIGSATNQRNFVAVTDLKNAVAIVAGSKHTCALVAGGKVRCWGLNANGQLGDGSTITRFTPVVVSGVVDAVAIAAGDSHSCALLSDGTARCWGLNTSGQLGDSTNTQRVTPVTVTNLAGAVGLAAGDIHTCALIANGTTRCWGNNRFGQLGDNTTLSRASSVLVSPLTDAIGIAAGGQHTCALSANGLMHCWGRNASGQIGDGTTTDRHIPTLVTVLALLGGIGGNPSFIPVGLGNGVQIATGGSHSCAISSNGAVFCWGENGNAQLGIGSTTDQQRPVAVPSFTLNIDPHAILGGKDREVLLDIIAVCDAGDELQVSVQLTQGSVTGVGNVHGKCTGALSNYPVVIHGHGPGNFVEGPAFAEATASIVGRGIVDQQAWTRTIDVGPAP